MKKFFLTYGDKNFNIAKKHLSLLAKESDFFDEVIALGPNDLDKEFKNQFNKILETKKGGGYWIWKYRIIENLLNDLSDDDLIIYCDAGASLNYKAKKRFDEYIEIIRDSSFETLEWNANLNTKKLTIQLNNYLIILM